MKQHNFYYFCVMILNRKVLLCKSIDTDFSQILKKYRLKLFFSRSINTTYWNEKAQIW